MWQGTSKSHQQALKATKQQYNKKRSNEKSSNFLSLVGGTEIFSDVVQLSFTYVGCCVGPENLLIFLSDCTASCRVWIVFETPCSIVFFIVIHIIHSRRAIQMIPARILRIFIRARALRFSHVIVLVCSSCPIGGSHAKAVQCLKLWARLIVLLGQLLCCLVERRWKRYDWKFISCRVKSQPAAKVEFSRSIWTNTYICVARSDEAKWKIDFSACQRYRWHRQWIRKHADKPEKCLRREHQAKSVREWNMINTLFWKVDKHFFISSPH